MYHNLERSEAFNSPFSTSNTNQMLLEEIILIQPLTRFFKKDPPVRYAILDL